MALKNSNGVHAEVGDLVSLGGYYGRYVLRPVTSVTFAHYAFYAHPSELPEDDGVAYGFHIPAASVKANHGPFGGPRLGAGLTAPLPTLPVVEEGLLVQDEYTNLPEEGEAAAQRLYALCADCGGETLIYDFEVPFFAEGSLGIRCRCGSGLERLSLNGSPLWTPS